MRLRRPLRSNDSSWHCSTGRVRSKARSKSDVPRHSRSQPREAVSVRRACWSARLRPRPGKGHPLLPWPMLPGADIRDRSCHAFCRARPAFSSRQWSLTSVGGCPSPSAVSASAEELIDAIGIPSHLSLPPLEYAALNICEDRASPGVKSSWTELRRERELNSSTTRSTRRRQ
jgi:hypothetical protein